jgi:prolycopene isomerase
LLALVALSLLLSCSQKADRAAPPGTEKASYDAVIIGAGGGGLAAAAKLALGGMKVLVIEQHDKVGGYMSRFERGPYQFEASLHAMDGLDEGGITNNTFRQLGILDRVKRVRLDPAYRSAFPDLTLDVPADPDAYCKRLQETFPAEAKGIADLFQALKDIDTSMLNLMNLQDRRDVGRTVWKIVSHPLTMWPMIKYWNTSCSEMLHDYVHDMRLIATITQLACFAGAEPDKVSGMFFAGMWSSYHLHGFTYFEGGSYAVANALAQVIREHGGEILLSTRATKIVMDGGRARAVQTQDGKEFTCRYVVSNANAPDTFFKMVGREHLPAEYVKKLEGLKIGLSAFVVYLGVDHDYRDSFPKGVHSYFVNTSFDQVANFRAYYEGIPEETTFGIVDYSLVDPQAAPEGKNVICLATIMPYDYKGDWHEGRSYGDYKALKEEVAMKLVKRAEAFLPGLSSHIEEMEVGSPRTMEHYTLNPRGTIFGWDNTPAQSLLKRLPQKTPIDNLYLAGAWTFPAGGQSAVLTSGLSAAKLILDRDK